MVKSPGVTAVEGRKITHAKAGAANRRRSCRKREMELNCIHWIEIISKITSHKLPDAEIICMLHHKRLANHRKLRNPFKCNPIKLPFLEPNSDNDALTRIRLPTHYLDNEYCCFVDNEKQQQQKSLATVPNATQTDQCKTDGGKMWNSNPYNNKTLMSFSHLQHSIKSISSFNFFSVKESQYRQWCNQPAILFCLPAIINSLFYRVFIDKPDALICETMKLKQTTRQKLREPT